MDYDTAKYKTVEVTERLEIPTLDDVSNGPEIVGAVVYATGNGISIEGVYRYDGSSYNQIGGAGTLSDSGTDTDGGDDYQLPNAADNLDLQSDGEIRNVQAVNTTDLSVDNVGVFSYPTSDVTAPDSTTTQIDLDQAQNDDDSELDAANNQIVVNSTGKYLISASVKATGGSWATGDSFTPTFEINGSSKVDPIQRKVGGKQENKHIPATKRNLSSGDTITLNLYQSSGGDATVKSGFYSTAISVTQIG